ncbi:MAG: pitrilysin family protein [Anaerolineae bacterium]
MTAALRPVQPIPGPEDILRRELPNGIVILARENFNAPSVVIAGALPAGALFETPDQSGLASFTARALMFGTQHLDFDAIHEALEGVGAELGIAAGIHTAGFGGKALAEDLPLLLDLLQDVLRHPTFPETHLERLRGQYLTALQIRADSTRFRANEAFYRLAYPPEHPYHHDPGGTLETLAGITREDVIRFHARHYGPRGLIITIVGAIPAETAVEAVSAALGDWQHPDQPPVPSLPLLPPLQTIRRESVHIPGKSQADLVLGVPGPPRNDPDYDAARVANSVLGQFGMYGRLGATIREKQGLAYYCYSTLNSQPGPAPWRVVAGVDPANVPQAVEGILAEIGRIRTEQVSAEELADNISYFTGSLPLQLENNEGVAAAILRMELFDLGLDSLQRFSDRLHTLTVEDLMRVAARFWTPEAYILTVAGDNVSLP